MNETRIACPENLGRDTGRELLDAVRKRHIREGETILLDLSKTLDMDSLGGSWLVRIADHVRKHRGELRWEGQHGSVAEFIKMVEPGLAAKPAHRRGEAGVLEGLGGKALGFTGEVRGFWELCVNAVYWTLIAPFEGKGFRWNLFIAEMYEMGVRAVPIVCLMNFLLGLIMAMLFAQQAEMFGLTLWVADLLMIGFAREMAAIMTATVVSARTGAAIAAELATMEVQEEIDALRGMGLNVTQFLVSPKLLALFIVMPCLLTLALIAGLLGGALWGVFVLGFPPSIWWNETLLAATTGDLMQGYLKTFVFAIFIVLIGCHNGLRVTGGSRGVGLMTTRAVVMDIFMLISVDIAFAAIFYYVHK